MSARKALELAPRVRELTARALRHLRLECRNRLSRSRVVGEGPVVSLTSYGSRISTVHITIESIGRGSVKPSQLLLWLDDPASLEHLPASLRRLQARGLEIHPTENFGPHTKYYPYVEDSPSAVTPLVTADDDVIYPVHWLRDLVETAARAEERVIVCNRARRVVLDEAGFAPYAEWGLVDHERPSALHFALGVSGVLYPPAFLAELRRRGRAFLACAPSADDVWLHAVAVESGYRVQVTPGGNPLFPTVERTQRVALKFSNVAGGRNDEQIRATYSAESVDRLAALAGRPSVFVP